MASLDGLLTTLLEVYQLRQIGGTIVFAQWGYCVSPQRSVSDRVSNGRGEGLKSGKFSLPEY